MEIMSKMRRQCSLFSKAPFWSKICESLIFSLDLGKRTRWHSVNFPNVQVTSDQVRSDLKELGLQGDLTLFSL